MASGPRDTLTALLRDFAHPLAAVSVGVALLVLADWLLLRRRTDLGVGARFPRQLALFVLTALVAVVVVLTLPVSETTRNQLLTLLGVILTGMIALSSTTMVANAMAGLMLRSVRSFRPGDFIRVAEHFGRVTEGGLFHTEIQTEERNLTTLPNLFLISNPVSVIRSSGTIVSVTLSLGYDVPHALVEPALLEAARAAELEDPFVHVVELGNSAVSYRVAGFLGEVRHLISVRSILHRKVLDALHGAGIEIVSPAFMNQRQLPPDRKVIPERAPAAPDDSRPVERRAEEIVFDKAEEAAQAERLREMHRELVAQIGDLERRLKEADESARPEIQRDLDRRTMQLQVIREVLKSGGQAPKKD